ncbi:MAG: D-alanyl-D-alanine carboxypeptidase [Bdellovibrionaceae bacterium]|nr:D-alanyl-D-alanine carboxypeptidase [Pseudobdellovibrionaceae bacterium]
MLKNQRSIVFFIFLFLGPTIWGSSLNSFCHLDAQKSSGLGIRGTNIDQKLPIASVSKLITSYWALIEKGRDYRFYTKVFYRKNVDGTGIVHIQGGNDPYFSKEFLHLVISELNLKGIKSVKELSFDEKFKFVWNINSTAVAVGDYTPESPTPDDVLRNLLRVKNLTTDYSKTLAFAKEHGISMVATAQLLVKKFSFLKTTEFHSDGFEFMTFRSSPLSVLLKEMNRNSNNYSANIIFESVGGAKDFKKFIENRLKLTTDDIEIFNGSGNKLSIEGSGNYNSARCSVVLKILIDFDNVLKAQSLKFEDIVSVVGADVTSSSSNLYNNEVTENSVIAKTGTVSPAILLAGVISTKKGNVYFMYNMKTNGTRRDWRDAQRKIKLQITNLIQKEYNGGVPISYQAIKFIPFDKESEESTEEMP